MTIDMGSLPSRQGNKKPRHGLSKSGVIETGPLIPLTNVKQPFMVQILDVDSSNPPGVNPSKRPIGPLDSGPKTLLRSEGLAWDRFKQAVSDKDVAICCDMSVKEFELSTVHNLFKVL